LTTTRWSSGHKEKLYFAGLLEEEKEIVLKLILREFDVNPRVTLVGKVSLATTLYAWSPNIDDIRERHQDNVFWRR
jgi:hypothetical protein